MIIFELEQSEEDKRKSEILGKQVSSRVKILKNGILVGQIFSPSSSGNNIGNAIQVCGFTEAFDLWGCGIFKGYKDIQLLFDEGVMGGIESKDILKDCQKCYRKPCQCDIKGYGMEMPFRVKREYELEGRIEKA
jgi:hypothetical protein